MAQFCMTMTMMTLYNDHASEYKFDCCFYIPALPKTMKQLYYKAVCKTRIPSPFTLHKNDNGKGQCHGTVSTPLIYSKRASLLFLKQILR